MIKVYENMLIIFPMAQQPLVGQGRSLSMRHDHTQAHDSPSQRPLPDNTQHSQQTDIYAPGGNRTYNPSNRGEADPRFRPRGHSNWLKYINKYLHNYILQHLSPILCASYSELFAFYCHVCRLASLNSFS
jgi:hypothetical protein